MATTTGLDATALDSLRLRMRGRVIEPHEDGYEEARSAWNALYDRRPEAVARCTGAADVMAAVDFAREEGVPLSVKGGGHDYAGNSRGDGGLLVDLSPMGAVEVDPDRRIARAQGGAKWGSLDHEAQAFGLAVPGPTVSSIGVGGAALGGGTGYLHRKHGLALDNVVSADVVTAAGDRVRASGDENRDLFWALRGGGGNFGVVTSFEFRLHEVGPEVLAGQIFHPYDDAAAVIRFARDFLADAPDALQCYSFILEVPEVEGFPAEQQGRTALALIVSYAGPVDEGEEALRPLRDFGDPFLDAVQPQPFTALQRSFDAGMPPGDRWYSRAHYLQELSDGLIDLVVERAEPLPGDFTVVYFEPLGGAVSRVDPSETAFPHRGSPCGIHILPGWTDPDRDDELMDWARSFHRAVEPYSTGGVYVNLLSHDQEDGVRSAYGENLGRLGELKAKWDPENLFRVNHNIQPGG